MIDARAASQVADALAAAGEPTRLRILFHLARGPLHVGALADLLGLPMVNMSHHLGVLRGAGLLADRKRGRRVEYSLDPAAVVSGADGAVLATLAVGSYRLALRSSDGGPSRAGKKRRR